MAERRFQAALTFLMGVNIVLLAVGTVLRTYTVEPQPGFSISLPKSDRGSREEPFIVPRINRTEEDAASVGEFNRTRWGRKFAFGEKDDTNYWKSLLPGNYARRPDFVVGITTVVRQNAGYLIDTLHSLISNLNEYRSLVIVVYLGEETANIANQTASDIAGNFSSEYAEGIIQVIRPPTGYYPDWKTELRQSFGDSFQRIKWRSKQNVDQLYLMSYSYYLRPKYYLMLEDDVLATSDYLSKIYTDVQSKVDRNFVLISYCQLGAIGKLLRRELLPSLTTYLRLFWADKPLDWLIQDYLRTRVCGLDDKEKDCARKIRDVEIVHNPSLFQHIGTKSSFPGKVQNLRDKSFKA